jgi:hypothetical protein
MNKIAQNRRRAPNMLHFYLKPSHIFEANKQAYADRHPQLGKKNRAMKLRNTISHFIS